jgi:2-polyprenyl-3-methyl-5-hydroxy-6-metoxy-1,4-benzoquinol methylase
MQNLPTAEVYEKEFVYMPWGKLVDEVLDIIINKAPQNGRVIDLMCGTGYLANKIKQKRPDLAVTAVDLESEFINFAHKNYPSIDFICADAFEWKPEGTFDVVLCMAGIHHLPYEKHEQFISKLGQLMNPSGFCIAADPYTRDYSNEQEQKVAAAELGYEYLTATVKNGAARDVIDATIEILRNDVMGIEFKTSVTKQIPYFHKYFSSVEMVKTWPDTGSEYGDYYFILKEAVQH